MSGDRIDALRRALETDPTNDALRLMLAELLAEEMDHGAAAEEFETLFEAEALPDDKLLSAGRSALRGAKLQLAARLLEAAREAGLGTKELQDDLERELTDEGGLLKLADGADERAEAKMLEREHAITFADVGGLDDVKDAIHKTIILPFQRPDLYLKYGRRAGGGALLYGPPGCGKTLMARATAGECGLPFLNLRIEDILDSYFGASEQRLHAAFEQARAEAPCVMFVDELDAIAFPRRKHPGGMGRSLVDQLLQELDSIGADNDNLLILAATNAPWDVDDALKRPGRFDRLMFVPPPDEAARRAILTKELTKRPTDGFAIDPFAERTKLYSGADLVAVVERAVDEVIDVALASGKEVPIAAKHMQSGLDASEPTTLDWLATARNFVEFANESGRYDPVSAYLRSPEGKGARKVLKRRD